MYVLIFSAKWLNNYNFFISSIHAYYYRPDERSCISTDDEVRGWFTIIQSLKACIDDIQKLLLFCFNKLNSVSFYIITVNNVFILQVRRCRSYIEFRFIFFIFILMRLTIEFIIWSRDIVVLSNILEKM